MQKTILFLCLTLCVSPFALGSNLPDLGAPDLKDYDSQTETSLGRAFSVALHEQYDLFYDPTTLSYVRHIGNKIASQTGQDRQFTFYILNDPEVNAFAGPNGVIGIHTGLILAAQTEDELASVMAHEIAHVTQRHLSRTFEYQNSVSVTSIASLIAAILIGSQDVSAGIATYMGGMGLNIQQQLKNSRIHENEADYFGIKYLEKAGYNPYAMSDFFGRLEKESQLSEFKAPEILLTHPVTEERLAKAKERAYQLSKDSKRVYHKNSLKLIQLRMKLLLHIDDSYGDKHLDKNEQCYLQNLKSLQSSDKAISSFNTSCLKDATKQYPNNKLYRLLQAQVDSVIKPKLGYDEFTYLEAIYPSDFSIPYLHALALEQNNQIGKAIELLRKATPKFHYQYLMYSELARLFSTQNEAKYSYYYNALANYNIGNTSKTLYLVKQAKLLEKDKSSLLFNKLIQLENQASMDQKIADQKLK
jgi:predicted Zn-dependent protease